MDHMWGNEENSKHISVCTLGLWVVRSVTALLKVLTIIV